MRKVHAGLLHPDVVKWNRREPEQLERKIESSQWHAREILASLPAGSRSTAFALFAAAPADRLFRWYDARPEDERRPYSLTWRPVLEDIWAHLTGDDSAYARISRALGEYYLGPYSNNGLEGPDDIDQDEAAATFYAANCVMHGLVDFALLSASRATNNVDHEWFGKDEERHRAEIAKELRRQAADLAAIAAAAHTGSALNQVVPADLIAQLRA